MRALVGAVASVYTKVNKDNKRALFSTYESAYVEQHVEDE